MFSQRFIFIFINMKKSLKNKNIVLKGSQEYVLKKAMYYQHSMSLATADESDNEKRMRIRSPSPTHHDSIPGTPPYRRRSLTPVNYPSPDQRGRSQDQRFRSQDQCLGSPDHRDRLVNQRFQASDQQIISNNIWSPDLRDRRRSLDNRERMPDNRDRTPDNLERSQNQVETPNSKVYQQF